MALRLRRGTDAERLTITPVESELIYTTDNKELFIGDGITVGGNKIGGIIPQFLSDLNNVDAASPQIGQVLKWDGSNWVATDDNDTGVIEGSNYRINIVDDNSTIMVDTSTGTFTGNFIGDLTGSLFNDANNKIVDSSSSTFTGTFVGDGSGLINLPISQDGSGIVEGSNYRINIVGDDSTLLVNGVNNSINTNGLTLQDNIIKVNTINNSLTISNDNVEPMRIESITNGNFGGFPIFDISSSRGTVEDKINVIAGDIVSGLKFSGWNDVQQAFVPAVAFAGRFRENAVMTESNPTSELGIITNGGGSNFNIFVFGPNGDFQAPGPIRPGAYADATARDTAITSPVAGDIIFLVDIAKHQGYDGTIWNNLY